MIWTNRFLTSSAAVRVKVFVLQWGTWRQPQFYHPLHPHFSNPQVRNLAIQSDLDNIFKMWREKNQIVLLDRYRVKMPRFATCDNDLIDKKFWPWCWPLRICNFVWRFPLCERQDGGEWSLQQSVGPSPAWSPLHKSDLNAPPRVTKSSAKCRLGMPSSALFCIQNILWSAAV